MTDAKSFEQLIERLRATDKPLSAEQVADALEAAVVAQEHRVGTLIAALIRQHLPADAVENLRTSATTAGSRSRRSTGRSASCAASGSDQVSATWA